LRYVNIGGAEQHTREKQPEVEDAMAKASEEINAP
jgi:hypothetical protein